MSRARRLELAGVAIAVGLFAALGTATSRAESNGIVEVTAKLVEIPSKFPPDDLYDYAYVMRYEVISGPLEKSSILVAHYKPVLARSKIKDKMKAHVGGKLRGFVQGDVHKLKLDPDLKAIWKGAVIDEFAATDHKSIRYWCLEANPG